MKDEMRADGQPIHVVVLGPAPGSSGGIGQLMDTYRQVASYAVDVAFIDPGATGSRRAIRWSSAALRLLIPWRTPDLVHINLASRGSAVRKVPLAWICSVRRIPFLIHLHGAEFRSFFASRASVIKWLIARAFRGATAVLVLGETWKQFVTEEVGVPPDRVRILSNCSNGPAEVPTRQTANRILFLGRVGERKGVDVLLESLPSLEGSEWHLTVAGDGQIDEFERLVPASLASQVRFVGWLDQAARVRAFERSEVLVLPSRAEGLPISLLEGMSWGLAPVVTGVGSMAEVVRHRHSGMIVPVGDPVALGGALNEVIRDGSLRAAIGANSRSEWEKRFSPDVWWASLLSEYRRALEPRSSARRSRRIRRRRLER